MNHNDLYCELARGMAPRGGTLHCHICQRQPLRIRVRGIARALKRGWPKCCDHTMRFERA